MPLSQETLVVLVLLHYRQTRQISDRSRTGSPRVTMPHEDRYLCTLHLCSCFLTVTLLVINSLGHRVSQQTVVRCFPNPPQRTFIDSTKSLFEIEMGPDCTT